MDIKVICTIEGFLKTKMSHLKKVFVVVRNLGHAFLLLSFIPHAHFFVRFWLAGKERKKDRNRASLLWLLINDLFSIFRAVYVFYNPLNKHIVALGTLFQYQKRSQISTIQLQIQTTHVFGRRNKKGMIDKVGLIWLTLFLMVPYKGYKKMLQ